MPRINYLYIIFLIFVTILSYSFVDPNYPIAGISFISILRQINPVIKTLGYILMIIGFLGFWIYLLKKSNIYSIKHIKKLIVLNVLILLFSYPAFSFDIFNYMATARVAFQYGENPYIVMPIEFSNDPILLFMHAANKTALYGPSWILLTFFPYIIGGTNIILSTFVFKSFISLFYIATCYLLYKLSKNNIKTVILFAFQPLVVIETLISSHNDICMMFFVLLSFFCLLKKQYIFTILFLISSIGIKFATVVIIPVYFYAFIKSNTIKLNTIMNRIWFTGTISMFVLFLTAPIREEFYSWYLIWPLTFAALLRNRKITILLTVLSIGLLLRFAPFIITKRWDGYVPMIKLLITIIPVSMVSLYYLLSYRLKK